MGVLLNRRRYMGALKQAKTLFEMYNQYFDGTVNSVVDTGLKLWDGTHNRWKMEVEYDAITAQYANNITLFSVKPDVTPYSGIRVRKGRAFDNNCDFTLTVGEACTVISNPGEFGFGTNSYGSNLYIGNTNSVNSFTLIRDGQYLYCDYNGQTATLEITDPKTNNLNLLIGCDYQGTSGTQRYYTGTVQKFVIKELPSADELIMTSITNPEVLAVCYAQGWCADANYMTKSEAEAVTSIGTVFYNNKNIKHFEEFEYFTSVTSIANNGIRNCTNLKTLVIPINVTSIGYDALRDSGIESLYVNCNNTSWWGNAYTFANTPIKYLYSNSKNTTPLGGLSKLETLVLSQNVETLGGFINSVLLENVTLPESLTTIGTNCFRGCSKLLTLNVPSGVTSIGNDAFRASGIKSIYIYGNISSWGVNTFTDTTLEYMYSNSQYTAPNAPASLIRLDLGSNVREVGGFGSTSVSIVNIQEGAETFYDNCFKGCSSLQSIVLPSTTLVMRDNVFNTCANLTSVTILATTPPTGVSQYTFMNTPNAIVYVPSGSVDAYKAASGWTLWASRIQAIPT